MGSVTGKKMTLGGAKEMILSWLWFWMILIAVLLFLIGMHVAEPSSEQSTQKVLYSAASAILSGGVFAALLKSFQYTNFFKNELRKVLYGDPEWLQTLEQGQLHLLWKNIVSASVKKVVPSLASKITERVSEEMIPKAEGYYYTGIRKQVDIVSYDPVARIIEVREELELDSAYTKESKVDYKFGLIGEWPQEFQERPYKITVLSVDNVDRLDEVKEDGVRGDLVVNTSYAIQLNGNSSYKILRHMHRKSNMRTDPVQEMTVTRFTESITLIVNNSMPETISTKLVSQSINDAFLKHTRVSNSQDRWDVAHLTFPGQGLTIVFIPQ